MENLEKFKKTIIVFLLICLGFSCSVAQSPEHSTHYGPSDFNLAIWFGLLELPFLFLCIFYCFKTSIALRGGIFSRGMKYLAWGFVVMAVGHIAMQVHHIFGFDVFRDLLGQTVGSLLWFIALSITWGLSAIGFYSIYKVSKKG